MLHQLLYFFLFFIYTFSCPNQNFCAACTTYNHSSICTKCYNSIFNANKNRCEIPKYEI